MGEMHRVVSLEELIDMSMFNLDPGFAINALQRHQVSVNKSLEHLATGKRINRASDDPAGLMRADVLMFEIRGIEKNLKAGELATHFIGRADGALSIIGEMLIELKGLVVTAANRGGMDQEELDGLQVQADEILNGISRIMQTTSFKGERLLAQGFGVKAGSHGIAMGGMNLIGLGRIVKPEDDPTINTTGQITQPPGTSGGNPVLNASGEPLSIASIHLGGELNLIDGDLELAGQSVESAIKSISMRRATMGAQLNGLHSEMKVWQSELESLLSAHSDLVDLDYAKEVSQLVRSQLMRDAALKAVVIGRENAKRALDLLVGSTKFVGNAGPIPVPSVSS